MNKQELQSLLEGVRTALTGNQPKLDRNRNNKIDREDFTLLRSKKKPMAENADLLRLLEHLYGVLLDQKAARLHEAPYGGSSGARYNASRGQSANPQNFYNVNRNDNDEIRASIYREDEKRKREEKELQRRAQMENTEYDSILEKIYNLLAEDAPPPTAEEPRGTVRPGYAPGTGPQERTSWFDARQWFADHGKDGEMIGPGPWNGTWEHPIFGTIFALYPDNIPGPHNGISWTGWRDGKQHEFPLPEGVKPGSGQWVMTTPPDSNQYYIVPLNDGTYAVWLWYGLPGANSYFQPQPPWGYAT